MPHFTICTSKSDRSEAANTRGFLSQRRIPLSRFVRMCLDELADDLRDNPTQAERSLERRYQAWLVGGPAPRLSGRLPADAAGQDKGAGAPETRDENLF